VPLLIEAGMHKVVDLVLLVYVPREIQIARLQDRDDLSRSEAELRLEAQMPLEEKKKYADVIINNSFTLKETARQVNKFWKNFK
jgi:dephospho-CoA kinase